MFLWLQKDDDRPNHSEMVVIIMFQKLKTLNAFAVSAIIIASFLFLLAGIRDILVYVIVLLLVSSASAYAAVVLYSIDVGGGSPQFTKFSQAFYTLAGSVTP